MATRKTNRLAEIVSSKRRQGSGVTSALAGGIKERLKEKFDPRQLINQQGLLTALFPGLRAYSARTGSVDKISKSSLQSSSFQEIKPILETISFNTKLTAKNTMVLPALHRDVNVIRQNMVKLVKLKGGDARTKADMFFMKAKEREDKYERELRKERAKSFGINKLLDQESDKGSEEKGFLATIVSVIQKAIGGIMKSILALGKAIVGVFKVLAGVVVNAITAVANLLLNTILGLAGLLKDGFGFLLDKLISDKILSLFKTTGIIAAILRSVAFSIIGWLFSKMGLRRLVTGMIPFLWPLLVAEFGLIGAGIFARAGSAEDPLTSEFVDRFKKQENLKGDDKTSQRFPDSKSNKKGVPMPISDRELFIQRSHLKKGIKDFMDSSIMNYGDEKIKPYELEVPGLAASQILFLNENEAKQWGDLRKGIMEDLDDYDTIKDNQIKGNKQKPGDENWKERLYELEESINDKKAVMLNWVEIIAEQQLDPNSEKLKYLKQAIAKAKKNQYETSFMDQMIEDFKGSDAVKYLETEAEKISDSLFSPIKDEAEELKNKPEEMKKKLLESLRDARTSANNSLGTVFKGGMEQFDKIQKHLDDKMNDVRSLIITPNNNNDAPAPAPPPASSWNEDFLKNDYFASTYEKWWRIG